MSTQERRLHRRYVRGSALIAAALAVHPPDALATTYNWIASTSGNWSDPTKWAASQVPASNLATQIFFGGTGAYTANNNLVNPFILNALLFSSGATESVGITGSTLSFQGSGTPGIANQGGRAISIGNTVQFQNTLLLQNTQNGSITINNAMSPTAATATATVTVMGAGTVSLMGPGTWGGGTNVAQSILQFNGASSIGTGPLSVNAATLRPLADADLSGRPVSISGSSVSIDTNTHHLTLNSVAGGATALNVSGGGMLTLMGNATYGGGTVVSNATLEATSQSAMGGGQISLDGARLRALANLDLAQPVSLNGGTSVIDTNLRSINSNGFIQSAVTVTANLTVMGGGTITLAGPANFVGTTRIDGAIAVISSPTSLGNGPIVLGNGGTLRPTIDISIGQPIQIDTGGGVIDTNFHYISKNGVSSTIGAVTATATLTVLGGGTLSIDGPSTLDGNINVITTTLRISDNSALGTSGTNSLTLNGATLLAAGDIDTAARPIIASGDIVTLDSNTHKIKINQWGGTVLMSANVIGGGTVSLLGPGPFSGGVNVTGGTTLEANNPAAIGFASGPGGGGSILLDNATLSALGNLDLSGGAVTVGGGGATFRTNANDIATGGVHNVTTTCFFTVMGGGSVSLLGPSDTFANIRVDAATLKVAVDPHSPITLGNGGTILALSDLILAAPVAIDTGGGVVNTNGLFVNRSGFVSAIGAVTATATLTVMGGGTLNIDGPSTLTGDVKVITTTLRINDNSALGASGANALWLNNATLQAGADIDLANRPIYLMGQTVTLDSNARRMSSSNFAAGNVTVTASVVAMGAGTVTLDGPGNFSGGISVIGGTTLQASNESGIGFHNGPGGTGGAILLDNGILSALGNLDFTGGTVTAGGGGANFRTNGFDIATSGIHSATATAYAAVMGGGSVSLLGPSDSLAGLRIDGATLKVSVVPNTPITLGNGGSILALNNIALAQPVLIDNGGGTINTGGNSRTINIPSVGNADALTFTAAMAVMGGGTVTIDGPSPFNGPINVVSTTLRVSNNNALGVSGANLLQLDGATLQAGADLDLGARPVLVAGASPVTLDSNTHHLSLRWGGPAPTTFPVAITVIGGGIVSLDGNANFSGPVTVTGATTLEAASESAIGFGGGGGGGGGSGGSIALEGSSTLRALRDLDLSGGEVSVASGTSTIDTNHHHITTSGMRTAPTGTANVLVMGLGSLDLLGPSTHTGGTTVNNAIVAIANDNALGTGPLTLTNGGTLRALTNVSFANNLQIGAGGGVVDTNSRAIAGGGCIRDVLNVTANALVTAMGGGSLSLKSLDIDGLTIPNGSLTHVRVQDSNASAANTAYLHQLSIGATEALDLNANDLVVQYGTGPSPFNAVRDLVFTGYSSAPDPGKTGIISSTGQSAGNTILAVIDNAFVGAQDWPIGSGHTILLNSVIGKYTYFGDMNFDGQVTPDDYGILDANLGTTPPVEIAWLSGDANLDGKVTADDYALLDANLGSGHGNPLAPASLGGVSPVPEPASVSLLVASGAVLLRRWRVRPPRRIH